jgi:hypothetical protein
LLLLLGALLAAPAHAQPASPTASTGVDFGNLAARWYTWVSAQEAVDVNGTNTFPILDTTGAYAAVGQENGIGPANKYFFLAGTFFDKPVIRTVTVPKGNALFFPIINFEKDNANDPPTNHTVPELKRLLKADADTTTLTSLSAEFDGKPVVISRAASPVFDYTVPAEHSFYDYFGQVGPQFEGRIKPAVADGYWSYIPPPTPGQHTLHFTSATSTGFKLEVTYNLTVA